MRRRVFSRLSRSVQAAMTRLDKTARVLPDGWLELRRGYFLGASRHVHGSQYLVSLPYQYAYSRQHVLSTVRSRMGRSSDLPLIRTRSGAPSLMGLLIAIANYFTAFHLVKVVSYRYDSGYEK